MAEFDIKAASPDTSLPSTGFLFGADSQASANPSIYSTQTVATALLGSTSLTGATVTTSQPLLDLTQTWNAGAVTFTGWKLNVTDTASASESLLMDLQVGGSSRAFASKSGILAAETILFDATGGTPFPIGATMQSAGILRFSRSNNGGAFYSPLNAIFDIAYDGIDYYANLINSASSYRINNDLFLTRKAAANLRLGAADAAAPVAQTLSVQSVVAGTSDTAGANFTIAGSQGTGTGAGGSLIFQVAPAGSSGSAQNALVTALTIQSNRNADFTAGITCTGMNATGNVGVLNNTNFLYLGASADVQLNRDAANTFALRNGTAAQEQRIYGSHTDATNFQRMSIKTLRESSGALSGATYVSTIAIPAYAVLIGVTTRVTTAITGATSYSVGDGSDVDLWGATIGVTLGSQSRTANFTAVAATGAAVASRTVTLTANGSNFTGGVVEICLHYLTTEAD